MGIVGSYASLLILFETTMTEKLLNFALTDVNILNKSTAVRAKLNSSMASIQF